jgi:uncharacterized protein (DUF1800 family)
MWTSNLPAKSGAAALCVTILCGVTAGCGFSLNEAAIIKMSAIQGTGNNLRVTQTMQFKTEAPVTWSVNGIIGGNAEVGTISSTGVYTAPAIVPLPNNQVTIGSSANIYPSSKGNYGVAVLNPIPIVNSITPGQFSEGKAQITVNGSAFVYGAQILWNGVAVPTTYISGTQLIAIITENTPGTYPVSVVNPDPGSASSQRINALVGPGQVVIQLMPTETSVRVNNTITITPTVTGSQDTALTWTVNGIAGGNGQIGTISAQGVYTAPAVVPTPNLVVVQATSVDNPNSVTIVNVQVLNPVPILLSAAPSSLNIGSATVVLTGASFINGATALENGSPIPTQFNSSGQLTATVDPTVAGPFDLQVLNPDPGAAVSADVVEQVAGTPPTPLVSPEDASRFLMQSTFGGSQADINHLSMIGYDAWFTEQFAIPNTLHEPYAEREIILNNPACAASDAVCNQKLFLQTYGDGNFEQPFWSSALTGKDALRKRVQFALSELFVVSAQDAIVGQMPRGVANYYDMLGNDSFGNYRQLLEDVTLSPMMGIYLSTLANDKGDANRDPDENYAREVMQLLTIGLNQLNPDGTTQLDGSGNPIPTYGLNDVVGIAKVFTGFSWNMPGNTSDQAWSGYGADYAGPGYGQDLLPMTAYPNHHSTDEKDFLGVTIPASGAPDPTGDLKFTLDTLFNHPNLPPFISKQLIQRLVTSNPSPAYVERVAAVFKDNGQGTRGDMKAVITAILMDDEARNLTTANAATYGRVQEPLLRFTHMARAFTAESLSGAFDIGSTEDPAYGLAEMASRSPSIFNWFAPGYVPAGTSIEQAGLTAPEMEITDVTTVIGYLNSMQSVVSSGYGNNQDLYMTLATETALANTPDQLLDRVNLLLLAGQMSSTLRNEILGAVNAISVPTSGDPNAINNALLARAQTAIFLTVASSEYTAQH